jgi:hypothetical protein
MMPGHLWSLVELKSLTNVKAARYALSALCLWRPPLVGADSVLVKRPSKGA